MTKLWHYELLCITEVLGYVLAGPIANQVLVAKWFEARRGRAMGYVYLGLGLGGVASPMLSNYLIRDFGWRHALEAIGLLIMVVLIPVGLLVTRSAPADLGLLPDGAGSTDAGRSYVHPDSQNRQPGESTFETPCAPGISGSSWQDPLWWWALSAQ